MGAARAALVLRVQASLGLVVLASAVAGEGTGPAQEQRISSVFADHLLVVPRHNLVLCFIDKAACAASNAVALKLQQPDAHFDLSHGISAGIWHKNEYKKHGMRLNDLREAMQNNTWVKAVFFRNPVDRFLSAYNSKCLPGHDYDRWAIVRDLILRRHATPHPRQ